MILTYIVYFVILISIKLSCQCLFKGFIKKKLFKVNFKIKIFMYFIRYIV